MSLIRTSVVPVHIYTRSIYPKKPIKIGDSEHEYMVIPGIHQSIKIDIPDIEFGYDLETKELMYRKRNVIITEWISIPKIESEEI